MMRKVCVETITNAIFCIGLLVVIAAVGKWLWRLRRTNQSLSKIAGLTLHPLVDIIGKLNYFFRKKGDFPLSLYIIENSCGLAEVFDKQMMYKYWMPFALIIVVYKPEAMEVFLNCKSSQGKSWEYRFLEPWLGSGLLTSNGTKWKSRRRILTPCFYSRILEGYLPIINDQSMLLVKKLKTMTDKEWVDISPLITLCTLDIISESIMGINIGAQAKTDSDYVRAIHELGDAINYRIWLPWLWPDCLFYMTAIGKRFKANLNTLHSFTRKIIKERKATWVYEPENETSAGEGKKDINMYLRKRTPFLKLLLDLHMNEKLLSEDDIREEVDTFMFEGHDTVGTGICWTLYCIGLYPEVQNKILLEQYNIFGDDRNKPVTSDDLRDMKYLECTLKESQRLFPSVPVIARTLEEDVIINGVTVPKGLIIYLSAYMLHRNKEEFPNPEVFDPERFLLENSIHRHPYAYVPFSAGPRNCIGQRFAMMTMKIVVSNILRHFHVISLDPRDKVNVKVEFVLRPIHPLRLKFLPRN